MKFVGWNCRGKGRILRSSRKMEYRARLMHSTGAQVTFVSETRSSKCTAEQLNAHFNSSASFIVPSEGFSGGLWLLWTDEVRLSVKCSSRYLIVALVHHIATNVDFVLACVYGDPHHRFTSMTWDHIFNFVNDNLGKPVVCLGDWNEIMCDMDTTSCNVNKYRMHAFNNFVKQCGFFDLGYSGPAYTWTNKRFSSIPIFERLDHCLANAEWCSLFTNTNVFNFPIMLSGHALFLFPFASQYHKPRLTFKFENWWTFEEDFQTVAKNAWETTASKSFHTRYTNLAGTLKKWFKKKKPIQQQLDCLQSQINDIQMQPLQQQDHDLEAKLIDQYENQVDDFTNSVPDKSEILEILKTMRRNASPGPDGFNVAFYISAWPWIGDDVKKVVTIFYTLGVQEDQITKSLCLRAWDDICTDKKAGGLGIRNPQAINQGLILSAAWKLSKEPHSQLAQILKAKYHHDTSIWRAKYNIPKSAFWTSVLKVQPLLISATAYQIVDGDSSLWSIPWIQGWETIYDNLIIQQQPFNYPAQIKDLWISKQKVWNVNLINSLFSPTVANSILQTPIIDATGHDILVWKLTPAGLFSPKSAYKHCFNNLQLPPRERPKTVPPRIVALLNQVWNEKQMAPRVQTFAWRLLRGALPTGKRAGKYSKHISETCSRCGNIEDEMHLFFLCSFSKAAWYCFPWFIKTGIFAQHNSLVPHMIQGLLDSQHPQISVTSLYMFLWCIWKARNDSVFCRKTFNPSQIYAAAMAIMQGTKLEFAASPQFCRDTGSTNPQVYTEHHVRQQDHVSHQVMPSPGSTITNITSFTGPVVFSDAAWTIGSDGQPTPARLGLLQLQQATFPTDSATLAKAAAAQCLILAPGHWTIRLQLARMAASLAFDSSRIYHIPRSYNFRAHHKAKLALKLQNRNFSYRCLTSGNDTCLNAYVVAQSPVMECTFVHVSCC